MPDQVTQPEERTPEADRLAQQLSDALTRIHALLKHTGTASYCQHCRLPIFFIRHQDTGKQAPYNPDGSIHVAPCTEAARSTTVATKETP